MVRKVNILIIMLIALVAYANGATYYISNSGSDDSSGTSEQAAWKTIGHACATMTGGDSLLFMGGTYAEQNGPDNDGYSTTMYITSSLSGTSSDPTVFKVAPGYSRPIIKGYGANGYNSSCTTMAVSFAVSNVHWIVFDSLIVKHARRGIYLRGGSNITIQYCVACSTGEGLTGINNNGGIYKGTSGVRLDFLTVQYCSLFTNWEESDGSGTGNCGQFQSYNLHYSTITNNVMFDGYQNEALVYIKGGSNDNIEISHNTLYGAPVNPGGGIMSLMADSLEIHHNVIYDCYKGIVIWNYAHEDYNNNGHLIYNNTIYGVEGSGITLMSSGAGGSIAGKGIEIFNNIVTQADVYRNLYKESDFTIENDDKYINYNCYWNSGSSDVIYWDNTAYTIAEARADLYIDSFSVSVDPVFADPANHDFRLTENSPSSVVSGGRDGAYLSYMGAYDPNLETFTISGTIALSGGSGLSGVTLSGLPGNPHTDNSGNYSANVTSGWSGTVTPALTGYDFSPPSRTYSGVNGDILNQDYTAWPDTIPPSIGDVETTNITDRSATISWNTDEPSTTQLEYGLTAGYGLFTTLDSVLIATHSVELDDLVSDTVYHFRARSIDAMGNEGISGDFTFRTLELDTIPPVISYVDTSNISGRSVTITWITNELATSQVDYGFTTGYGQSSNLNPALVLNHNVTLSNLLPDTLYHFRVRSADASGNDTVSGDFEFHSDTLSISDWNIISVGVTNAVSGTYPGYTTTAINDSVVDPRGGISSTWASDESSTLPHWVEFDFDDTVLVAGIIVYWAWNNYNSSWMCSQQYWIQYRNEEGMFVDIETVNNSVADSVTVTWFDTAVTTTHIRYYQPANMGPPDYSTIVWLTELEIYGDAGIPAPEPIGTVIISDSSAMVFANPVNVQMPVYYEFALDIDSTYPNPRIEPPLIVDTVISTTFDGLYSQYTYYWKCRAIASDLSDTSSWSWSEAFNTYSTDTQAYSYAYPDSSEEVTSRYIEFSIIFDSSPNIVYIEIDRNADFNTSFGTMATDVSQGSASWEPASSQDSASVRNVFRDSGWYYWRASTDGINWITFPFKLTLDSYAYPVPFRQSEGHSQITFTNLPENSKIVIASVSGAIVYTKSGVGPGDWAWDVRNDKGRDLASGVYLYAVESEGGTTRGKIVVIR